MITTLWIIGLIFFALSLIFGTIADGCRLYRTTRLCENWSLAFILTAVTLFGTAMYLTGQEEKGSATKSAAGHSEQSASCR